MIAVGGAGSSGLPALASGTRTITNTSINGGTDLNTQVVPGDVLTDSIQNGIIDLGFKTPGSKLLFWGLLSVIVGLIFGAIAGGLLQNGIVGGGVFALTFLTMVIVGVFINMVPLWVIIVMVLLGAGAAAMIFRGAFTG